MIDNPLIYTLYVDGGVIGSNPSPKGGVWAWCLVNSLERRIACDSGIVRPKDYGLRNITNNLTELLAAINGLEAMDQEWRGKIWTDSRITFLRLIKKNTKFNGIPGELVTRCFQLRNNRKWRAHLLKGHPTKKDLRKGHTDKYKPVSIHNVWCDKECRRLSQWFLEKHG